MFGFQAGKRPKKRGNKLKKLRHLWRWKKTFLAWYENALFKRLIITLFVKLLVLVSANHSKGSRGNREGSGLRGEKITLS